MTEMDKLKNGEEFQNRDEEISAAKLRARTLAQKLNAVPVEDQEQLLTAAKELFGSVGDNLCLKTPVQCDFGFNIHIGNSVLINYNCVFDRFSAPGKKARNDTLVHSICCGKLLHPFFK